MPHLPVLPGHFLGGVWLPHLEVATCNIRIFIQLSMATFRLLTCLLAISRKLQSPCFLQRRIGIMRESAANQLQKNGKRQDCSKTKEGVLGTCSFQACPERPRNRKHDWRDGLLISAQMLALAFAKPESCSNRRVGISSWNQRLGRKFSKTKQWNKSNK